MHRRIIGFLTGVVSVLLAACGARADSTWEYAVQVSATVDAAATKVTLSWPQDTLRTPASYTVSRKTVEASSWGAGVTLSGATTSYVDTSITPGTIYEYQVVKAANGYTGYGYVAVGAQAPLIEQRGKLVLVVDASKAANLAGELSRLQQDLVGDGWTVIRHDVAPTDNVAAVKSLIKAAYASDPANVKAVFLFGRIPVPYSGNIVPDGHSPDHLGAWPADVYYGDMDGAWTDSSVNNGGAFAVRNRNVPGDGKFDQSTLPSPVELQVGRVDLANMPGRTVWNGPANFPSEEALLRQYLNKDHNYRHKVFSAPRRALIHDTFGTRGGEAFAASAYRNYAAYFGANNLSAVDKGVWISTLKNNNYLCAYACGGGSYSSIVGLGVNGQYQEGNTVDLVNADIKAVFVMLMGSWLGDWDSEDNIMRGVLATASQGLACGWSGRPHWFCHHMGVGYPIGYSARLTQNNAANGIYKNQINSYAGGVHVALMGDPTLRLHTVAPPSGLTATAGNGGVTLNWKASAETVQGYHVYRAANAAGPFTRLSSELVNGLTFTHATAGSGAFTYMVRSVKLESSGSGTYFNPSQGVFATVGNVSNPPPAGDTTAPVVALSAPANNASVSGTVNVSASATDNVGVAGVQFRLDGVNLGAEDTAAPYSVSWNTTSAANGAHQLSAVARDAAGNRTTAATRTVTVNNTPTTPTNPPAGGSVVSVSWVDEGLPAGAVAGADGGDGWNWISANPAPVSGKLAHQSSLGAGPHQHYFSFASATLTPAAGEYLYAYVYLDPANPPRELMLQWKAGASWEHRAYWGANLIGYGASGTAGRFNAGALPAAGQWARLEVPAKAVGLEGQAINGMAFSLYDGRAAWDHAGKASGAAGNGGTPTNPPPADTTAPVITLSAPANNASVSGTVSVSASATDNVGVAGVQFRLDGANLGAEDTTAPYSVSWNTASAANGAHQLSAVARDAAGNRTTGATRTVTVNNVTTNPPPADTTAPVVSLSAPANNASVSGTITVSASATDNVGVAGVQFRLDGANLGAEDTAAPYTFSWNTASAANGAHQLSAVARDAAGNRATAATRTVTVNNTTTTNNPPATNTPPVTLSVVDYANLQLPKPGDHTLHVLTPTMLELQLINLKPVDPATVSQWNWVSTSGQFSAPALSKFAVTVNGNPVSVTRVGFKRRPFYATALRRDLRLLNSLYLELSSAVPANAVVEVRNPDATLWPAANKFNATANQARYSPAIHVNQEGYMPAFPKKAMVGYYLGNLGEMTVTDTTFKLVDQDTGLEVFQGTLKPRPDVGYTYTPLPYQKVLEADFSSFKTPGEYRLVVPSLGASLAFMIDDGIAMNFTRAYALGMYHQRCGTNNALPFTRHTHDSCHTAMADVPLPQTSFNFTWTCIAGKSADYASTPRHTARQLKDVASQLYPMLRTGKIDVSGGHHDAGDYSKYTINSAALAHYLLFAMDSFPGVGELDNLGLPNSGDGIPDFLQEAKWETDFLAKMQDTDGGFYFLVYPREREYEWGVLPDHGDAQVVWPKTTAVTASSVAALAQAGSSPLFKRHYPEVAARYMQQAELGWKFLTNAIARYGKDGSYQKITHYGHEYLHDDELAWAAAAMFTATGNEAYHQALKSWFNPSDPATLRWGWWRLYESYGAAIRCYAFAARSGRLPASKLDTAYLAKCEEQVRLCAQETLKRSLDTAYGTSFPAESKSYRSGGWYFSSERAFDMTVGYQLDPRPEYLAAVIENMNFEGGCNPANASFVTGLGWKRQRNVVHQYTIVSRQLLPPGGLPQGNIYQSYIYTDFYKGELTAMVYPSDTATTAPFPFYDRWGDVFNVSTEFVVLDQARSLGSLAFLATLTPLKSQAWTSGQVNIIVPKVVSPGTSADVTLQAPGLNLDNARITWEARDHEPAFGRSFTLTPKNNGEHWIEVEVQWPDGRRVSAATTVDADGPTTTWVDDDLPAGAVTGTEGNDSWSWISANPAPYSGILAHQTAASTGYRQHFFYNATSTMAVKTGDKLFAYVYLDSANPPSEIMLQWQSGNWDHRAYWGADSINLGTAGTASKRSMGALPAGGRWVRLEVPASQVGLEGQTVSGMAFSAYGGGRILWDAAGRSSQ